MSLALLTLALVTEQLGRPEQAKQAAEEAHQADVSWTGPLLWLALHALQQDDAAAAERLLRSVPNPTTEAHNLRLGLRNSLRLGIAPSTLARLVVLAKSPTTPALLDELRSMATAYPKFGEINELLAWKLLRLGQDDAAEQALDGLVATAGHSQSVAALRFGLQMYRRFMSTRADKLAAKREPPPTTDETTATPAADTTRVMRKAALNREPTLEQPLSAAQALLAHHEEHHSFTGEISLFGVPDLLQFFCNSRRTGTLMLYSQSEQIEIRLQMGEICWAKSSALPSDTDHLPATEALGDQARPLPAPSLLREGTQTVVERVSLRGEQEARHDIERETREAIGQAVKWSDGWFDFKKSVGDATYPADMLFDCQGLLLDALRELDELGRDGFGPGAD